LLEQSVKLFSSAFAFPGLSTSLILIAIGLAIVFGAVWVAAYMPSLLKDRWLWLVAIVSAFVTWTCIAFIQVPLQLLSGQALLLFWDQNTLQSAAVFSGIPSTLLSGLVQEGSKLLPIVIFWLINKKRLDPITGLIAGAMSGAGFGVFEATWIHNTIFNSGWTLHSLTVNGPIALVGFWERFFTVGFHTSVSALAGYGLASGKGWQFYLLASLLHGVINYGAVLYQLKIFNVVSVEIYVAAIAILVSAAALWLRWRSQGPRVNVSPDMT
jgi:RsiW-degrading membrane proteinase PrsW (M82 family)